MDELTILTNVSELQELEFVDDSNGFRNSVDVAVYEMQQTYEEKVPYSIAKTIDGERYVWNTDFIDKVLYSLSTDDLDNMNSVEYGIIVGFLLFQNRHSHTNSTTQVTAGAIGCTAPDANGNSYAVYNSGISTSLCLNPYYDVARDSVYKSLDSVLIYILNCEDWQNAGIKSGTLYSVSECEI